MNRGLNKRAEAAPPAVIEVGTAVAAKYDGQWFRAVVVRMPCTVQFVDYGNIEEVDEVKMLDEGFLDIPAFAVVVSLNREAGVGDDEQVEMSRMGDVIRAEKSIFLNCRSVREGVFCGEILAKKRSGYKDIFA
jgi:hypothetical protein